MTSCQFFNLVVFKRNYCYFIWRIKFPSERLILSDRLMKSTYFLPFQDHIYIWSKKGLLAAGAFKLRSSIGLYLIYVIFGRDGLGEGGWHIHHSSHIFLLWNELLRNLVHSSTIDQKRKNIYDENCMPWCIYLL